MQSLPPQYYAPYGNAPTHYQSPPPHMMQPHQQPLAMNLSQLPATQPELNANGKPKRKQVKNACVNCQKACKKCDDGRPCQRCVKYGLVETCIDSVRKERKKGVKRGPYKRRNQGNSSSPSASPTPAHNNVYVQSPASSAAAQAMRPLPFNYPNFPQYDSFNGASGYPTYGYSNMMPPSYQHNPSMVPYPGMGVMPPQQQQHDTMNNRQVSHSPQYPTQQQQQQQQITEVKPQPIEAGEDEDGNKLSILSQLCSAVLDNTDAPKQEGIEDGQRQQQQQQQHQEQQQHAPSRYLPVSNGTPPPSRGHSRTSSFEHSEYHVPAASTFGHDSPHTYVNGQLRANVYGTPNSSPSHSPINSNYKPPAASSASSWPLPSIQSVVSSPQSQGQGHHNNSNWQAGW